MFYREYLYAKREHTWEQVSYCLLFSTTSLQNILDIKIVGITLLCKGTWKKKDVNIFDTASWPYIKTVLFRNSSYFKISDESNCSIVEKNYVLMWRRMIDVCSSFKIIADVIISKLQLRHSVHL